MGLRAQVAALAQAGAPVIAKCAGLLYLARSLDGHPMCGVLDASAAMTGRLTLGYRDAVAAAPSPPAQPGHACTATSFTAPPSGPPVGRRRVALEALGRPCTEGFVPAAYMPPICTHWNGIPGAAARITAAARAYREARSHG